jgi:biopolymer transport protein TolR
MGAGVMPKAAGSRSRGRRRKAAPMSEINVTPFVDVMLVLLIIFMVAAPLLTVGVPVELPRTAAGALPGEQEEPLSITLTADGRLLVQTTEIAPAEMLTRLRAISAERESGTIYLRADAEVPFARVAEVMGALNAGGFTKIGFVTDTDGPRMDGSGN